MYDCMMYALYQGTKGTKLLHSTRNLFLVFLSLSSSSLLPCSQVNMALQTLRGLSASRTWPWHFGSMVGC